MGLSSKVPAGPAEVQEGVCDHDGLRKVFGSLLPTPQARGAPACQRPPARVQSRSRVAVSHPTAKGRRAASAREAREARGRASQSSRQAGSPAFRAASASGGRQGLRAAAADRVTHPGVAADLYPTPHLPLGRAHLRSRAARGPPPPPFCGARPGSARGARRPDRRRAPAPRGARPAHGLAGRRAPALRAR